MKISHFHLINSDGRISRYIFSDSKAMTAVLAPTIINKGKYSVRPDGLAQYRMSNGEIFIPCSVPANTTKRLDTFRIPPHAPRQD